MGDPAIDGTCTPQKSGRGRGILLFMDEFFTYIFYLIERKKIIVKFFISYLIDRCFILY